MFNAVYSVQEELTDMHVMCGRVNDIATEARRLYARCLQIPFLEKFAKDCGVQVHRANNTIYPEDQGSYF